MDRTTSALLRALDDVGPHLRALVERAAGPDAPPRDAQLDEATDQLVRAFVALLRDAGTELSRYSRRVRVRRDGVYRVKVAGDADHINGFSRIRRLDVG